MLKLFHWLSRWPLGLLHLAGGVMGWVVYFGSPTYRRRFKANIAQANVPAAARRRAIGEAGRMLMELPCLWRADALEVLEGRISCTGLEHIDAAHEAGRGLVLLTPHLGCFEITAQAYAQRYARRHGPITVLYRPARKAWLRELVAESRHKPGLISAAPATLAGVRQMIRALRRGETIGLLPDQVPPEGMGAWAPFFGKPVYTMTLAARLVQQTGASVLLIWGERLPRGDGYIVHVEPFGEPLPADPEAQAESAAAVNRAMERLIMQRPDQYLWGYNRYKMPRQPDVPTNAPKDTPAGSTSTPSSS